jgi:hypothetical protein
VTTLFTPREKWHGGVYELTMELGPPDDARFLEALTTLWSDPALAGPYADNDREPEEQERVAITAAALERSSLYGVATLPNGLRCACASYAVRGDGDDWLDISLPLASLGDIYPVGGYPFERGEQGQRWREPLDARFRAIGERIFARVPFRLGIIGFEVSGLTSARELAESGIPDPTYVSYLVPEGDGVRFVPVNRWA